ncbi:MAG: hypothetical protein Q7V09_20785 [Hydrogenophaga sp.]|uniref:phage major capsid protein n=1 Tax=Hydrogenophaga sp. TaxID=1904254 RepID=UPI002724C98F|nr:hypothetical protein [Hydrogenophaga sp.]MDO9032871.1 hypothetical protein [Hydrogenophaga sp.]
MSNYTLNHRQIQERTMGMVNAMHHRLNPSAPATLEGREYRSMSLVEMAREFYEMHGRNTSGMSRMDFSREALKTRGGAMMATGDFTSLLADVARKRLRDGYQENPGTYKLWARRAPNAPDFKPINAVSLSGAPALLRIEESGEFQYGQIKDGGETYSVVTYGRMVAFTRQAMINDDLRSFDRLVQTFGASAQRLENRLVYSQITENGNMADGTPLFHADHGNLATGVDSWLGVGSLATGRAAMRRQLGADGEPLSIGPAFLIVPASLEQLSYQLTSSQYTPAKSSDTNEFREGGRTALTPIVEPLLDGSSSTAWYLASSTSAVDTVEYCYLDGAEGPVIEQQESFGIDGTSFKCRLDFATKAIDRVGLYRANGN